jgi:hypothetical protein
LMLKIDKLPKTWRKPSEPKENRHDKLLRVLQAPCFHDIN